MMMHLLTSVHLQSRLASGASDVKEFFAQWIELFSLSLSHVDDDDDDDVFAAFSSALRSSCCCCYVAAAITAGE
jgi:hypothetical protein